MRILTILFILLTITTAYAQDTRIVLVWDANTEPELRGYKIYYGLESKVYITGIDVGLTVTPFNPEYAVIGLDPSKVWYFAATAYDNRDDESGYSNEVSGIPIIISVKTPGEVLNPFINQNP